MIIGGIIYFFTKHVPASSLRLVMKITNLSTRTLFGGFLGIGLAFILAEFSSRGLYDVYSTSTFFRTITGNSPNALADGLMKVSWALLFCTSWWMLWR